MGGKTTGAMVYGVVQYDFNAERADELEAKAGEAIIVVAQSNPEWFVAKPIGRLGGPGLIPVSFVDIKDTATMKSVPDPLEAVRKAGVPRVEEWKKFAAEYKNSSISLGKFDGSVQQATNDVGRMSIQNSQGRSPYVRLSLLQKISTDTSSHLLQTQIPIYYQHPYKRPYHDIVSTMICTGISSSVNLTTVDGSNYHDITQTSTIYK